MATVLSHPAVPLGLGLALGSKNVPPALVLVGAAGSVLPDVDAIGFWLGVPYGSLFGHRGVTHSLFFAAVTAALAAGLASHIGVGRWGSFFFVFISSVSHGFLDAMTHGGLGVAFLSPVSNQRYFLPWRGLEVSPIGLHVGSRGLAILMSELRYVWLPCIALGLCGVVLRQWRDRKESW